MHDDTPQFQVLLAKAKQHDRQAFDALIAPYWDFFTRIATKKLDPAVRQQLGASAVVSEAFLAAWIDFSKFEGRTPEQLNAWLMRVLLNKLLNACRDAGRQVRDYHRNQPLDGLLGAELRARQPSPSEPVRRAEENDRLERALGELPEELATPLLLRYIEGFAMEDICRLLNASRRTIRRRIMEAIVQLRERLQNPEEAQR